MPDEAIRPALELAFAASVLAARPPTSVPLPAALRPFARFQKLPTAALAAVRRVLDADDAFRERLAASVDADLLGRPSQLYLARPPHWEAELAAAVAEQDLAQAIALDAREERSARRRLAAAEAAARRAGAELAAATLELAVRADGVAVLERRAAELERALAGSEEERRGLERRLRAAEQRANAAEQRANAAEARANAAEQRLAEMEAAPPTNGPTVPAVGPAVDRALEVMDDAVVRLAAAVERARGLLEPSPASTPGPRERRREPLAVVRGLPAHAAELARAWLATPGVILLVDGYNVAKLGWPRESLPVQRERLLDALEAMEARLGTQVEVVFDGADLGAARPSGRRHVRVSFSPPGVSADEMILELLAALAAAIPVIVATDDGAVREAARRRHGATLIGSRQLLAAARC